MITQSKEIHESRDGLGLQLGVETVNEAGVYRNTAGQGRKNLRVMKCRNLAANAETSCHKIEGCHSTGSAASDGVDGTEDGFPGEIHGVPELEVIDTESACIPPHAVHPLDDAHETSHIASRCLDKGTSELSGPLAGVRWSCS